MPFSIDDKTREMREAFRQHYGKDWCDAAVRDQAFAWSAAWFRRELDLPQRQPHSCVGLVCAMAHSAVRAMLTGLVGKNVAVEFAMPLSEWPFPGTPAHLHVYGVEGPLIALGDRAFMGCPPPTPQWVALGIIKTIRATG